jgi:hypothetical protein
MTAVLNRAANLPAKSIYVPTGANSPRDPGHMARVPTIAPAPAGAPVEPTPSTLEGKRFNLPVELLMEALTEASERARLAPLEQVVPSTEAVQEARTLLEILPTDIQVPEPVVESSGTIAWVWDREVGKFLALAVNGSGLVQRSASIDGEESWETTPMIGRLTAEELMLLARFSVSHA